MTALEKKEEGVATTDLKVGIGASTQESTHTCNKAVSQTMKDFISSNNTWAEMEYNTFSNLH